MPYAIEYKNTSMMEDMVIAVVIVSVIEVAVEIVEGTEEVMAVVMRIASDPVKMGVTMVSFPFEYYVL